MRPHLTANRQPVHVALRAHGLSFSRLQDDSIVRNLLSRLLAIVSWLGVINVTCKAEPLKYMCPMPWLVILDPTSYHIGPRAAGCICWRSPGLDSR